MLTIVEGIPLQMTTDCGSETTQLHGLAMALRFVLLDPFTSMSYILRAIAKSIIQISIIANSLHISICVVFTTFPLSALGFGLGWSSVSMLSCTSREGRKRVYISPMMNNTSSLGYFNCFLLLTSSFLGSYASGFGRNSSVNCSRSSLTHGTPIRPVRIRRRLDHQACHLMSHLHFRKGGEERTAFCQSTT